MVFLSDEEICNKIENNEYTLFDKILCGGLGYGNFCMPTMIFKILFTIIFPPLGILINNLNPERKTPLKDSFPYISKEHFINIFSRIDEFIIAFILTMMFYIPGLVYVMTKFKSMGQVFETVEDTSQKSSFENTEKEIKDDEESDSEYEIDEDLDEEKFKNIDLNKLRKQLLEKK